MVSIPLSIVWKKNNGKRFFREEVYGSGVSTPVWSCGDHGDCFDVPHFHGKVDTHAFHFKTGFGSCHLTIIFEWFGMSNEPQVRFVNIKLKGQAWVWCHGVEYLHVMSLKGSHVGATNLDVSLIHVSFVFKFTIVNRMMYQSI